MTTLDAGSIDERIARHRDALSPQERRAAATLLEHLDDLATYRAAELADLAGVSKATMSRLFRSLGYTGFDEVREHLRALRAAGEPRALEPRADAAGHAAQEAEAVRRAVSQPALGEAVDLIARAGRVSVVGWRNGYPVALHLRQQLAQARGDVRLAPQPGQLIGEELADVGPGDALVVLGFRRRPAGFAAFLTAARATGAAIVLVADPSAARYATDTVWLECEVHGVLAYDSYAAAMSLAAVLADGVLRHLGEPARARVTGISTTYDRMHEVE
ncbi:MurR/RpiR family transcriptional regulator [Nocardioides acrostichi]|uniref:MurR/RpiR family transcriptional regulator n=1 Tax=Nocardioides acrostichi TaxID=2784339 RepID=A0A930Y6R6_9ACTN|nr:MurR/RpiR family transcriptional regulator [Nocardioides acrostichi]MBF4161226.1 MurR/RpiR family transcriptional regulator [Nocardioides acrostichi]